MNASEAWALRRHNGDRRVDQQDPEIARGIAEATRPVIDKLTNEVSMCVRYYSVAFRGQPLKRMIVAGGEATAALAERLGTQLDIKSELGDPLRAFESASLPGRRCQWDVALGLAMRKGE
jgi:type IV pilus assembly protein PilM